MGEFIIFANNDNAQYDSQSFSPQATFVFCNHGCLYKNHENSANCIEWYSRNNPYFQHNPFWNDKINGGRVLPKIPNLKLNVCSNYMPWLGKSDFAKLSSSKSQIETQLTRSCELVDEQELHEYFKIQDFGKCLSTGAIAALDIRRKHPQATILVVGFTRYFGSSDREHDYFHEHNILKSQNIIWIE